MYRLTLTSEEIVYIQKLLKHIKAQYNCVEDTQFLDDAILFAQELPRRLRALLRDFKLLESVPGICLISGYPVDAETIGRTPPHWKEKILPSPSLDEEILLVLFGSLLGDVFGWSTQQDGCIVHDLLPIKGHEYEQLGSGSEQTLVWHTEEAFHSYRGDYLGLMCLRNPYHAQTTYASLDGIHLEPRHLEVLFEARFTIRPDESHFLKNRSSSERVLAEADVLLKKAYQKIELMNCQPEKIPVLFGSPASPYLRIDPYFMDPMHDDEEAQQALDVLMHEIDAHLAAIPFQPGDICFLDNYRVVHGRGSFIAKYDGYDRWLKRVNITRDLRKSRDMRASATSRIIY
ncbi:MAG TPA: guanitoxin biosynthesis L-enduracididine beta-hydroxylase GntD [Ktedonobacteraceae bacterium]|jgi:Fe(II)/alpha-ketoglutarate-dependent arginine beta-hydroxylase|nr:guanitoxin biosynthesis L-enduracididine beta-hydroxylase GntD [Ktedonobacteraceae bacterium]